MLSMCGILCRFLRGWRQTEAAGIMTHAAALSDASLIVETIDPSTDKNIENELPSLFCQPVCESEFSGKKQLLWRDNNKQAKLIYPKQKVNLMRWTLFLSSSEWPLEEVDNSVKNGPTDIRSCPTSIAGTPINSPSRRNSVFTLTDETVITVLLEASYRKKDEVSLYGYDVMVEHLAEPFAWKARDLFGVIVRTTPSKLVSMIHALFNNALIIDDDLSIRKIITVILVGEPSLLSDPSTISTSVTPGPWSQQKDHLSQFELARTIPIVSPGNTPKVTVEGEELTDALTFENGVGNNCRNPSLLHAAKVSSQSSEEDGSFESDTSPLQVNQFCPRGWAISGLKSKPNRHGKQNVVLGQPLSRFGIVPGRRNLEAAFNTSIITNPFDKLMSDKETLLGKTNENPESKEKKVTFNFTDEFAFTRPTDGMHSARMDSMQSARSKRMARRGWNPMIPFRHTYSFHGRENISKRKYGPMKFSMAEHLSHPFRTSSEMDLVKSSSIIRDNLANIIENYLTKSLTYEKVSQSKSDNESEHSTLSSINEELKSDNVYRASDEKSEQEFFFVTPKKDKSTNDILLVHHSPVESSSESEMVTTERFYHGDLKLSAKGQQSKLHRQDSTESEFDFSISEDSLMDMPSTNDQWIAHSSAYEEQCLKYILTPEERQQLRKKAKNLKLLNQLNVINSFSEDSLEIRKLKSNTINIKNYILKPSSKSNDSSSGGGTISTDSIERLNTNESQSLSSIDFLDTRQSSLEENSFSVDDSIVEAKIKAISEVNLSILSSPDDFSTKSESNEASFADFPSHWHEEFVKVFSTVNQTMNPEALILTSTPTTSKTLETINELESISKESPIMFSVSEDDLYSKSSDMMNKSLYFEDSECVSLDKINLSFAESEVVHSNNDSQEITTEGAISQCSNDKKEICETDFINSKESLSNSTLVDKEVCDFSDLLNLKAESAQLSKLLEQQLDKAEIRPMSLPLSPITKVNFEITENCEPCYIAEENEANKENVRQETIEVTTELMESKKPTITYDNAVLRSVAKDITNKVIEHSINAVNSSSNLTDAKEVDQSGEFSGRFIEGVCPLQTQNTSENFNNNSNVSVLKCFLPGNKMTENVDSTNLFNFIEKQENQIDRPVSASFSEDSLEEGCNNLSFNKANEKDDATPVNTRDNAVPLQEVLHSLSKSSLKSDDIHLPEQSQKKVDYLVKASECPVIPEEVNEHVHENVLSKDSQNSTSSLPSKSEKTDNNNIKQHSLVSSKDSNDTDLDVYSYFNREISVEKEDPTNLYQENIASVSKNGDFLSQTLPIDSSPFFKPEDTFGFSVSVKSILSPVDSATESGFASLKDSSHSEGTSESGSVVPFSKSKDSLEMTDSEKNHGHDNLSDEFDLTSTLIADQPSTKSDPVSVEGNLLDVNEAKDFIFSSKNLDVDKVIIPSYQLLEKGKNLKYMRNSSLDPEVLTNCSSSMTDGNRVPSPNNKYSHSQFDDKEIVLKRTGSEESEDQILKTSDSISSNDTIVSKASFDEQNKIIKSDKKFVPNRQDSYSESEISANVSEVDNDLNSAPSSKTDFDCSIISAEINNLLLKSSDDLQNNEATSKNRSSSPLNEDLEECHLKETLLDIQTDRSLGPQIELKDHILKISTFTSLEDDTESLESTGHHSLELFTKKDTAESFTSNVTHCHSEGNLDKPKHFETGQSKFKNKSVTSFHNSSSSGEFSNDKASLKSQDSFDQFTHFDLVSAHPKPRRKPKRKVLSVDVVSSVKEKVHPLLHSKTLPGELPRVKEETKSNKEQKIKKKKGNSDSGSDKKSTLSSIKGFLKLNKSKEKDNSFKLSSPSLFKKLEIKVKGGSPQSETKKKGNSSPKNIPVEVHQPKEVIPKVVQPVVIPLNDKTHLMSSPREGVTKMGIKSTLHRLNAMGNGNSPSLDEKSQISPNGCPHIRKQSLNGSPHLYRHVLLRNLSGSQESLDVPLIPNDVSPRRAIGECHSLPIGKEFVSSSPVMGTRALKASQKSFSVTIGLKPNEGGSPSKSKPASMSEDLNSVSRSTTPSQMDPTCSSSTLSKRSSSMEILVYGKIREHGSGGRRRSSSGGSREGSFRLHREISVETLVEIPEGGPPLNDKENYQDYLQRVQASRDSRQNSMWSLCDNDGSFSDSIAPTSLPCYYSPNENQLTSTLPRKVSSPYNVSLSGGVSSSNPNLTRVQSPFMRGVALSSSFTSSPYRRLHSSTSNISPTKRTFASQNKNGSSQINNEACPSDSLMEEEEDENLEPVRINMDQDNEKAPNILIYTANNSQYYEAVKETMENSLSRHRYVMYHLTDEIAFKSPWAGSTTLLIVCGDVPTHVATVFIRYLLNGGRVFSICSDFLNVAVPLFGTVEVQEEAVVSMSYNKWKNVQLLHHQHCFHSSPKHKRFSTNMEKQKKNSAVSVEPTYVEIKDEYGRNHRMDLKVLAKDDTWGAPSLLVANVNDGLGKALFSQVHLEKDTNQSITLDLKGGQIKRCNEDRLEILKDLLQRHLGLDICNEKHKNNSLTHGYLLGRHELKHNFLEEFKLSTSGQLERSNLLLQFLKDKISMQCPTKEILPVLMTGYPENFSTVKYFEALETTEIGRLSIYSDVMTSTMDVVVGKSPLVHGLAVMTMQQLTGRGRQGNLWLSPVGSVLFSLQLHLPLSSNMGQSLPFLQHLTAMAVVLAIKGQKGYEGIPLHLKWPNDIYLGSNTKIGGILVEASTHKGNVIANIGCGVNLLNSNPTTCINDAIQNYNMENGTHLREVDRETFYANCFNHLEQLLQKFQTQGSNEVIQQYYEHWLHGNVQVNVQNEIGQSQGATIVGIDQFGFLVARLNSGEVINLHPDGNSFNMMEGLIYTKLPRKFP